MPYEPAAIANYFLDLAEKNGESLTPMKVQKLVYFAHGWHLAFRDSPLIDETIQAWKFGPVIKSLYRDLREFGRNGIKGRIRMVRKKPGADSSPTHGTIRDLFKQFEFYEPAIPECDTYAISLMGEIWKVYSKYTGIQLSNVTHSPDSPWSAVVKVFGGDPPKNTTIPDETIRDYFKAKQAES
jgi:uncharacterized phage-associated protein